jgi:3-oxoacyl-[acyl-carrier protein] reductase
MGKLAGKAAVVTGASKGIGAAIAKALAAEGAAVVVNYSRGKAGADKVVDAITAPGGKAVAVGGDVTRRFEIRGPDPDESRCLAIVPPWRARRVSLFLPRPLL